MMENTAAHGWHPEHKMTINIVHLEDEIALLEGMRFVLEEIEPEAHVTQFAKSDTILDYIDEHCNEIALFILDIRVPGPVDGLGVARHIRKIGCHAVIIITSAYGITLGPGIARSQHALLPQTMGSAGNHPEDARACKKVGAFPG
ncbi:MAG: response regulator [Anaerolineae bacterium]|nr:response regulator [Anaerolineae bacterium]